MKTKSKHLTVILILCALFFAGCANPAPQSPSPQSAEPEVAATATLAPPTETPMPVPTTAATQPLPTEAPAAQATPTLPLLSATIMAMTERINAGDLDGAMDYWADDARVYFFGLPPTGTEVYLGKEQFRSVFAENVASHFQWEVDIRSSMGDQVQTRAKTWHDFTRQLGVAPLEATEVYVIEDGKIVTMAWTITEESLARLKPALAEVMPPEPTVAATSEEPAAEFLVTISGGTCTYDGPMTLLHGEIQVTMDVKDQDQEGYALTFFNLEPDKDFADLMASTVEAGPPAWSDMLSMVELGPGESQTYGLTVDQGPVYLVCWSTPPDLPIGAVGPFTVSPNPAALLPIPAPEEGPAS